MSKLTRLRPSPALVVALAALVAATSGAALALPGKNAVTKNDIRKNAVTGKAIANDAVKTSEIARGAIGSQEIKGKSIRGNRLKDKAIKAKQIDDKAVTTAKIDDNAVTSAQVAANGLNTSDLADVKTFATQPVTAVDGVDEAAAVAAAPRTELFKKGQLTVYAKCVRDATADLVYANVYIETSANGAIFNGDDELNGGPAASDFLNTNTDEELRELESETDAPVDDTDTNEGAFMAMAPDGTKLVGQLSTAAKHGELAGGNGVYGAGNVCLFSGQISG